MTVLIVLGGSVIVFVLFVVLPVCWLTSASHERWGEKYWADLRPPVTDDPQEWTAPLHGGRSLGRRMWADLAAKGIMLPRRASVRTRRVMAVLDARRPRRSFLPRRHVCPAPVQVVEAPPELHHEHNIPGLLSAPLPEVDEPLRAVGVRLTADPPVPPDDAPLYSWQTGQFAAVMTDELVAKYMPDEMTTAARAEVAALTERHHALLDGTAGWRDWDESLTCWDRNEVAIEESGAALDDAQAELARLENRGN